MPLSAVLVDIGTESNTPREFYTSLEQLDRAPLEEPNDLIAYRPPQKDQPARPKLLVCHDYKGGYQDLPNAISYTFNYWALCDTFIYFAHHRVSPPPPAWVNAAHRHGTKILGTLIFEHNVDEEMLRLLVGPLPTKSRSDETLTFPSPDASGGRQFTLSDHYAKLLAHLAVIRGFDGYLLNFESPLSAGSEQAKLLGAWVHLLKHELRRTVGRHAEVIWYDSVTVEGALRWQDRLSALNLPFFLASDSLFTNYTWHPAFPYFSQVYFRSLAAAVRGPKTVSDLYIGIDTWGRGSHGGGGFNIYQAMEHVQPQQLGLSVALFGQAWTWESKESAPGRTWAQWWADETRLWLGPDEPRGPTDIPVEMPGGGVDYHGAYRGISSFFSLKPISLATPFFTNFCPGVGFSWFEEGRRVMPSGNGWTDVGKQTSIGNACWPSPTIILPDGSPITDIEECSTQFDFDDAWHGGSCLAISIPTFLASSSPTMIPIETVVFERGQMYSVRLVVKPEVNRSSDFRYIGIGIPELDIDPGNSFPTMAGNFTNNWINMQLYVDVPAGTTPTVTANVCVALSQSKSEDSGNFKIFVGELAIYAVDSVRCRPTISSLRWTPSADRKSFSGQLSWTEASYLPYTANSVARPATWDDPNPAWFFGNDDNLPTPAWQVGFAYHNIYALPFISGSGAALSVEDAIFLGTSGCDGRSKAISVPTINGFAGEPDADTIRFYVRGVTETGEVVDPKITASIDLPYTP